MISVLIADDHPVVRAGLRRIIADEPTMQVVGEAADGDELVAKLAATVVDVLLLDITMPGAPFLTLLRHLRDTYPIIRVLVLSMHSEDQYAVRALRGGAVGYLTKEHSPEELVAAIAKVACGGKYVTAAIAQKLASMLDADYADAPHDALSDREHEVLCGLGVGKGVKQIAAELGLSPKTISTYRTRILEKMHLSTNADLIRYALQQGIVE
jgi:two-component system invasion response regulator UvrY